MATYTIGDEVGNMQSLWCFLEFFSISSIQAKGFGSFVDII